MYLPRKLVPVLSTTPPSTATTTPEIQIHNKYLHAIDYHMKWFYRIQIELVFIIHAR